MQPPVPEALFARPEDKGFGFPKPNGTPNAWDLPDDAPDFYCHWVPDELRDRLGRADWRAVSAARTERAEAIVAAWDAYDAADRAAFEVSGLDLTDEDVPLWERLGDMQAVIAKTPARTTAGVMLKARVAADEARQEHGKRYRLASDEDAMTSIVRANGSAGEATLAMAVVFDLLRLREAPHG
jgi:hypothetical protein